MGKPKAHHVVGIVFGLVASTSRPAQAQSARITSITVDSAVTLEVIDWGGSGRPVVLLAGNGQTAHSFDQFAPTLAPYYHVYAITRRGFGASSKPATGYRTDRLADDVLAVLDSLRLTNPVLAGHSLAGAELSSIGSRKPGRVAGLVYLDPSTAALDDGTRGDFIVDVAEVKNHLDDLRAAGARGRTAAMDSLLSVLLETDLPALQRALTRMQDTIRQMPPVVGFPLMPPPTTGVARAIDDGRQRYTSVRVPVLAFFAVTNAPVGVGSDSAATQRWLRETTHTAGQFARTVPGARIRVLVNAQHYVFRSNGPEVLSQMRSFIDGLPRR